MHGIQYVTIAEEGIRYSEKELRFKCLTEFVTTVTETESGTGIDTLHFFVSWDVPLMFNDNRPPEDVDVWSNEVPSWVDGEGAGTQGGEGTTPTGGSHEQVPPQASPPQPKKMPRPQQSSGASTSSSSAFFTGTGPSPGLSEPVRNENWIPDVDWIKRKRPSSVEVRVHSGDDYAHHEQRISFLRSKRNFMPSSVDGPHLTREVGTNLQWRQYMRRLTFYPAVSYNILTEGQLDSHMINSEDFERLQLYHYIVTYTELIRCKGWMLTLGVDETVRGDLRSNLKSLKNEIRQSIIDKPWMDKWDELGGQVRNNRSLVLMDLTYQIRSSARNIHDIEAGLNNMGMSFLKVYQLPYEGIENPDTFLKTAGDALNSLRKNVQTIQNITFHVWISFTPLIKRHSRILVPDDEYVKKLAEIIIEMNKSSPLPIFVNILTDARFLRSQSSIASIAKEFASLMKGKGILHSTNEKFWKQMYACGGEPHYWKQGEGKEMIWAIMEKSLIRHLLALRNGLQRDALPQRGMYSHQGHRAYPR